MGTPLVLGDRILLTTTTTGTGAYAIAAAVTGYLTPALAGLSSVTRLPYVAVARLTVRRGHLRHGGTSRR